MTDNRPLVSIIIPVYNVMEYLRDTLDCILGQTYRNLEILLVDDGSKDGSEDCCDEYAQRDSRLHVFHIPNGGVASARNFALKQLRGEYCMFVDADDLVSPYYVETMLNAALGSAAEIVTCRHMSGRHHSPTVFFQMTCPISPQIKQISLQDYRYTNRYAHDTVWAALYQTTAVQGLFFSTDLYVGEDTLFFAEALKRVKGFIYVDAQLYYYRYRDNSLAHHQYDLRLGSEITSWERLCGLFSDSSPDFLNECRAALARRIRKNYSNARSAHFSDSAYIRSLREKMRNCLPYVLRSKVLPGREKIFYLSYCLFPGVLQFFYDRKKRVLHTFDICLWRGSVRRSIKSRKRRNNDSVWKDA